MLGDDTRLFSVGLSEDEQVNMLLINIYEFVFRYSVMFLHMNPLSNLGEISKIHTHHLNSWTAIQLWEDLSIFFK